MVVVAVAGMPVEASVMGVMLIGMPAGGTAAVAIGAALAGTVEVGAGIMMATVRAGELDPR